jgi:hypothetical protein
MKVNIISKPGLLVSNLSNAFEKQNINVTIINTDLDNFHAENSHYNIFICDDTIVNDIQKIKSFIEAGKLSYKNLFIFSYKNSLQIYSNILEILNKIKNTPDLVAGIIYISEIVDNGKITPDIFRNTYPYTDSDSLNPVNISWLVERIFKFTLSMNAYGKSTALIGTEISNEKQKHVTNQIIKADYDEVEYCPERVSLESKRNTMESDNFKIEDFTMTDEEPLLVSSDDISKPDNLNDTGGFIYYIKTKIFNRKRVNNSAMFSSLHNKLQKNEIINPIKNSRKKIYFHKITKLFIILVTTYFIVPIALFYIALCLFRLSGIFNVNKYPAVNRIFVEIIISFSDVSNKMSDMNKNILFIGQFYDRISVNSNSLKQKNNLVSQLVLTNIDILNISKKFVDGKLSNNFDEFNKLTSDIEYLINSIGFYQVDQSNEEILTSQYGAEKLSDMRNRLFNIKVFASNMTELLAKNKLKKYAIVIQNTDVSRPSGGIIEAIAIVTLNNGKIYEIRIYNPSQINDKVKGELEPPGDFKIFSPGLNWNFDNATWFNDFSTSANKIEWFVDQSLDENVDSIIALNDKGIKKIVENKNFTEKDDLSSKINIVQQGESNLSIKEFVSFLSILLDSRNYENNNLILNLADELYSKDILIHLDSNNINEAFTNLKWGGALKSDDCEKNCLVDTTILNEITKNFGSNKIDREVDIDIAFEEKIIKKRLTVYLKNLNNSVYNTIFMLSVVNNSGFSPVTTLSNNNKITTPGYLSGSGFLKNNEIEIKIDSYQSYAVSYYWETPYQMTEDVYDYAFDFIKQPGINTYNLKITLHPPNKIKLLDKKDFSLTSDGTLVYNTKLLTDLRAKVSWQK